jgi:hypothetical protein
LRRTAGGFDINDGQIVPSHGSYMYHECFRLTRIVFCFLRVCLCGKDGFCSAMLN